jgi:hypothetical protein
LQAQSRMLQKAVAPALLRLRIFVNVSVNEKLLLTTSKSMLRKFWAKLVDQVTKKIIVETEIGKILNIVFDEIQIDMSQASVWYKH